MTRSEAYELSRRRRRGLGRRGRPADRSGSRSAGHGALARRRPGMACSTRLPPARDRGPVRAPRSGVIVVSTLAAPRSAPLRPERLPGLPCFARQSARDVRGRRRAAPDGRLGPRLGLRRRHGRADPGQGHVLTALSRVLVRRTADLVPNHVLARSDDCPTALHPWPWTDRGAGVAPGAAAPSASTSSASCAATWPARAGPNTAAHGTMAGEPLPPGLVESQQLPRADLHASDQGRSGHDENISRARLAACSVASAGGAAGSASSLDSIRLARRTPPERGLILADTKFEFGWLDGELLLIDEALTPDSSRYWPADAIARAARSRASTSSSCATIWSQPAGTRSRRHRRYPMTWYERPRRNTARPICG